MNWQQGKVQAQVRREQWKNCHLCGTPYEQEDLHPVGLTMYLCRWHYQFLKASAA